MKRRKAVLTQTLLYWERFGNKIIYSNNETPRNPKNKKKINFDVESENSLEKESAEKFPAFKFQKNLEEEEKDDSFEKKDFKEEGVIFVDEEEKFFGDSIKNIKGLNDNLIGRRNIFNYEDSIENNIKNNTHDHLVDRSKSIKVKEKRKNSLKNKSKRKIFEVGKNFKKKIKQRRFCFKQKQKEEGFKQTNKTTKNSLNSLKERIKKFGKKRNTLKNPKKYEKSEKLIRKFSMRKIPKLELNYKEKIGKTFSKNEYRREDTGLNKIERKLKILTTKEDTNFLDVSEDNT